ncbi:MAG: deiodinase family protein, partial [Gemmataceae bacterium]|nr:deiodinase family protein [Gemmataceae bacterium]
AFSARGRLGMHHNPPPDPRRALMRAGPAGLGRGDAPSIPMLVRSLYGSELGSLHEGPPLDGPAPDFELKSPDGATTIRLSKLIGPKPVVLVLGNFTCGPFRALVPEVEAVHRRFKGRAEFVMVYVREAHPTDGWAMESNARAGVAVKQPTTAAERAAVCELFRAKVKPEMPVVVDDIDDRVGNAYSGMPGRLYVIDPAGTVAYKSGRGPFGFKAGEMEQALALALLEAEKR